MTSLVSMSRLNGPDEGRSSTGSATVTALSSTLNTTPLRLSSCACVCCVTSVGRRPTMSPGWKRCAGSALPPEGHRRTSERPPRPMEVSSRRRRRSAAPRCTISLRFSSFTSFDSACCSISSSPSCLATNVSMSCGCSSPVSAASSGFTSFSLTTCCCAMLRSAVLGMPLPTGTSD